MPLALFILAMLVATIAIKGNYNEAGTLFNTTFFGGGNGSGFLTWFGSMIGIAVIFRIIQAPKAGELFLLLLIVIYFVQNQGVVSALEAAIQRQGAHP